MERNIEDILSLMLDELDLATIEHLEKKKDYITCKKAYYTLTETLEHQLPEMPSLSQLIFQILEMERREALLVGMKAGFELFRMCDDNKGQNDLTFYINEEITKKITFSSI